MKFLLDRSFGSFSPSSVGSTVLEPVVKRHMVVGGGDRAKVLTQFGHKNKSKEEVKESHSPVGPSPQDLEGSR